MIRRLYLACVVVVLALLSACGNTSAALLPTSTPAPTAAPAASAPTMSVSAAPTITAPPTAALPTPSPQPAAPAAFLVFPTYNGGLARLDAVGKPLRMLADPTEDHTTLPWAASPDGKTIAFVTGRGVWSQDGVTPELALWFVDSDATHPRKVQELLPKRTLDLTPGGEDGFALLPALIDYQELAWRPDGSAVAFISDHDDQVEVYSAALNGTVTRLTHSAALKQGPVWSPDGTRLAVRTTNNFGTGAGWSDVGFNVVSQRGDVVFAPTLGKLHAGTEALGMPDLLWTSANELLVGLWDFEIGNAEIRRYPIGGKPTVIFSKPYSALAWNAATHQLAIAGTEAALVQNSQLTRALAPGLYLWQSSAQGVTQITDAPIEAVAWNPINSALAYSGNTETPGIGVWIMSATTTRVGPSARTLLWSPDGAQLAADSRIYHNDGMPASVSTQAGVPVAWLPQGLCLYTGEQLLLWDGAQIMSMVQLVNSPEKTRVVVRR